MVDLDAYFRRIGFSGDRTPSRATLDALCAAHVKAIPFENLDVLLGRAIELSDEAIDRKLIHGGRGGYCFEQNTLFSRVLTALGFQTRLASARVRLQRPRDFIPARTHVFNVVTLDGEERVADVGVGGLSPTASFLLHTDAEQPSPHEPRRVVREGALAFHQVKLGDAWADVWESTLETMHPIDREVANWFTSAHPQSHFKNRLLAARALDDGGRVTLLNRELTHRTRTSVRTTVIGDPDELLAVLATHFGLRFPEGTRFEGPPFAWGQPLQPQ